MNTRPVHIFIHISIGPNIFILREIYCVILCKQFHFVDKKSENRGRFSKNKDIIFHVFWFLNWPQILGTEVNVKACNYTVSQ